MFAKLNLRYLKLLNNMKEITLYMLWLKRSWVVCGCVFCFVIGLFFFFFCQTNLVLNPSHFASISNITYLCNKMFFEDCMKQSWCWENSNLSVCEVVMTLQQSLLFCKCLGVPLSHSHLFYVSNWKRGCLLRVSFKKTWGLPWWRSGYESSCQRRGHGFEPWSRKIPHAAEQLSPCTTTTEPAL